MGNHLAFQEVQIVAPVQQQKNIQKNKHAITITNTITIAHCTSSSHLNRICFDANLEPNQAVESHNAIAHRFAHRFAIIFDFTMSGDINFFKDNFSF